MKPFLLPLFLLAFAAPYRADLTNALARLPACGTNCIIGAIPASTCAITNTTCLCTDQSFYLIVQDCVFTNCSGLDATETAGFQADMCGLPRRLRKVEIHAAGALHGVALVTLLVRLYSRWYTNARFALDDWITLSILPLFITFLFCGHYAGYLAFGTDIWYVDPADVTEALKIFYAGESLYVVLLGLTKIAVLCFYLRIFPQPLFRKITFVVMGWIVISTCVFLLLQLLQCIPIESVWLGWQANPLSALQEDHSPHCLNVNALGLALASSSIAQDLAVMVLPLPSLFHLNVPLRSRLGVIFMFSLGIFILITSCIRVRFILVFAASRNPTWDATDALIWSGFEVAVSIIVASLPAIRVLLRTAFPRLFSTSPWSLPRSLTKRFPKPRSQAQPRGSNQEPNESQVELSDTKTAGAAATQIDGTYASPRERSSREEGKQTGQADESGRIYGYHWSVSGGRG